MQADLLDSSDGHHQSTQTCRCMQCFQRTWHLDGKMSSWRLNKMKLAVKLKSVLYNRCFLPQSPACKTVRLSLPKAHAVTLRLHGFTYVLPSVPQTGLFADPQSEIGWQAHWAIPSELTMQTWFFGQRELIPSHIPKHYPGMLTRSLHHFIERYCGKTDASQTNLLLQYNFFQSSQLKGCNRNRRRISRNMGRTIYSRLSAHWQVAAAVGTPLLQK